MLSSKKRGGGFTLIELAIGLAVLAILLGLGVPAFTDFLQNQKIRMRAESLVSGLQAARGDAVQLNTVASFMLSATAPDSGNVAALANNTSGPHWAVRANVLDAATGTAAMTLLDSQNGAEGSGSTSTVLTATTGLVSFNAFGNATNGATEAISIKPTTGTCVADGGHLRCLEVRVSASGQIRMCDPAVSAAGDTRRCF